MKSLRLPLAVTGVAALLGMYLLLPQHPAPTALADEHGQPPESVARAEELSSGFRWVANKTLPSIVSIRTVRKIESPRMTRMQMDDPFGGFGSPLDDLFGELRPQLRGQPGQGGGSITAGQGSGFIFDPDGLIMTNSHVVRGADEVYVVLDSGKEYKAIDIRADDFADVAVVRIKADEPLAAVELGDDAKLEIGDWVLAFGSPFGLDRTVTQGIISAKSRALKNLPTRQEFLQTDAAINPGNSGGPLVNLRGEVVGINTAIETRSGGYDGVGFAVPVSLARWVSDQLVQDGKVRRAYLGIKPDDVTPEIARSLELPTSKGVIVTEVTRKSPAETAGVEVQDVIVELNNRSVTSRQQLITIAERLTIGDSYPLVVLRDGRKIELSIVAAEFPEQIADAGKEIESLGIEAQMLTPELAEQLELDIDSGVVVTSVARGGMAARMGLRPGHVIARVGKTDIGSIEDLNDALTEARERRQLVMLVKTANGTQLISVPFSGGE